MEKMAFFLPFHFLSWRDRNKKKRATLVVTDGALRRPSEAPASLCSSPRAPRKRGFWLAGRWKSGFLRLRLRLVELFSRQTTNLDSGNCLLLVLVTLFKWQSPRVRLSELLINLHLHIELGLSNQIQPRQTNQSTNTTTLLCSSITFKHAISSRGSLQVFTNCAPSLLLS